MTPEQLQAAYFKGLDSVPRASGQMVRHTAGLAEVARQQAERDIEIAKSLVPLVMPLTARSETKRHIAHAVRAQFEKANTRE